MSDIDISIDFSVLQPKDLRRVLGIKNDADYNLVVKSWRFLFDFLYAVKDGTQIVSNLVNFTKCENFSVLVSSEDGRQLELEFNPNIDEDDLFEEFLGVLDDTKIVRLPTI